MKAPPKHAPARIASRADLRAFQRLMALALVRPLGRDDGLDPRWIDGRRTADIAAEFVKPNDRLTSAERLEIYSRSYWYRLLNCMHDDCPALRALLGEDRFARLARAYLARHPSRSFTLRNLCARLEAFVASRPRLAAPHAALAREVARFEWAQTVAFDGEARSPIGAAEIARTPPARLRLGLQPYLTLLELRHPVDDFVRAVGRRNALRTEASNAVDSGGREGARTRRVPRPRRRRTHVAVHRLQDRLYYKRLDAAAFRILSALREGRTLTQAVAAGGRRTKPRQIHAWFATWMALGWFCRPPSAGRRK